ncbi:(R,R)-butanediol dehydrogenase [Cladophialophora carrionii]|uniref:(R,R)-butanediol dehydrogenase n=1 Tax=Cladophialophora carrionii TaxID=86049 RepID=A0A1C1C9T8_9EURO|nr:(R,R)-butanediol dehydrogenase [Cladophialophora carrionii]
MGHEFCGRVSQASAGCTLRPGQAVMVDPRMYCKSCDRCRASQTNICRRWAFKGLHGHGGGFSEAVAVDEDMCHALPSSVPLSDAALIEPLVVGRHALKSSGMARFDDLAVLIIGGGPVGLAVIFNLRARGARRIYVSEPTLQRQKQTADFAARVFNPLHDKVGDKCRELTNGEGVDLVFDCAGFGPGLKDGMDALRSGGTYVNVAGWETPFVVPMEHFMPKELILRVAMSYTDADFREVVQDYLDGKFEGVERMITSRIVLDDVVQKGFEELVTNKDDHVKIMVTPKRRNIQDQ